jgi:hypothetical protein
MVPTTMRQLDSYPFPQGISNSRQQKMSQALVPLLPYPAQAEVEKAQMNLAQKALQLNSYLPYLPSCGYKVPDSTCPDYHPEWKQKADLTTTPKIIAEIYLNLYDHGFIPAYDRPESFVVVSNGTNIPTYERLMFDLDRTYRKSQTHVISLDLQTFPHSLLQALTVGKEPQQGGRMFDEHENTHQFIRCAEEDFSLGKQSVDLIWTYRASLYFYLRAFFRLSPEILNNAKKLLKKYHRELRSSGCVVVDAVEYSRGKSSDTEMYASTGSLLLDFREELDLDKLFDTYMIGQNQAKVLVLRKKIIYN